MKSFTEICELCCMARELAKTCFKWACEFLYNNGISLRDALACLIYKPLRSN